MSYWQVWNRRELFLKAYARIGKIGKAAAATEIPVATVESWQRRDTHSFKKRMQLAHQKCVESWEEEMDQQLKGPTGNRGSDVLLMFKLKAEAPEKYREEVKVLGVSAPLQMLDKLRELAARDIKAREALEAPDIAGEFKEVATVGEERPVQSAIPAPEPPKKTNKPPGRVRRR
jgi:hypothetical protein